MTRKNEPFTEHTPTERTRKYVYEASRARVKTKDICHAVGVSHKTLHKYYAKELRRGRNYLPRVAVNKIVEFLSIPAESVIEGKDGNPTTVVDNGLLCEQAKLAAKIMPYHGWKQGVEIDFSQPLRRVITNRLPEDPDDV